jgi:ribulose-5-phosphate 4-epimerase/fuculose-1-phosphate aldolase
MTQRSRDLHERVATACRVLARLDLTPAGQGHVSARISGTDRILIRARGAGELGVRYTTADQVIEVNLDGKLAANDAGDLAVPLEVFIHTEVYRARPDVNSVIHIHPPNVVLFTVCDKPLLPIYGSYDPAGLQLLLDGIPTYDRSILIRTPQLGADLAKTMGDAKVCMMRGHGITTAGSSIEEAAMHAIGLSELAAMNYKAYLLGNPRPISEEDQAEFRSFERAPVSGGGGLPGGRVGAAWRYYVTVTDSASA